MQSQQPDPSQDLSLLRNLRDSILAGTHPLFRVPARLHPLPYRTETRQDRHGDTGLAPAAEEEALPLRGGMDLDDDGTRPSDRVTSPAPKDVTAPFANTAQSVNDDEAEEGELVVTEVAKAEDPPPALANDDDAAAAVGRPHVEVLVLDDDDDDDEDEDESTGEDKLSTDKLRQDEERAEPIIVGADDHDSLPDYVDSSDEEDDDFDPSILVVRPPLSNTTTTPTAASTALRRPGAVVEELILDDPDEDDGDAAATPTETADVPPLSTLRSPSPSGVNPRSTTSPAVGGAESAPSIASNNNKMQLPSAQRHATSLTLRLKLEKERLAAAEARLAAARVGSTGAATPILSTSRDASPAPAAPSPSAAPVITSTEAIAAAAVVGTEATSSAPVFEPPPILAPVAIRPASVVSPPPSSVPAANQPVEASPVVTAPPAPPSSDVVIVEPAPDAGQKKSTRPPSTTATTKTTPKKATSPDPSIASSAAAVPPPTESSRSSEKRTAPPQKRSQPGTAPARDEPRKRQRGGAGGGSGGGGGGGGGPDSRGGGPPAFRRRSRSPPPLPRAGGRPNGNHDPRGGPSTRTAGDRDRDRDLPPPSSSSSRGFDHGGLRPRFPDEVDFLVRRGGDSRPVREEWLHGEYREGMQGRRPHSPPPPPHGRPYSPPPPPGFGGPPRASRYSMSPPPSRRPLSPPPPQRLAPRSEFRQYTGAPPPLPPGADRRDPRYRRSLSPPPPPLPPLGLDDYHDGYPRFDIPRPGFQRYNGPPPPPAMYDRPRSPPPLPPQSLSRGPVRTKTAERPPPFFLPPFQGVPLVQFLIPAFPSLSSSFLRLFRCRGICSRRLLCLRMRSRLTTHAAGLSRPSCRRPVSAARRRLVMTSVTTTDLSRLGIATMMTAGIAIETFDAMMCLRLLNRVAAA